MSNFIAVVERLWAKFYKFVIQIYDIGYGKIRDIASGRC